MSAPHPPVIGACLTVSAAEQLKTWLFDKDRDLEIQDFVFPETLESGGQDIVGQYAGLLDGFKGRIGIHEILGTDTDLQRLIISNPSRDELTDYVQKHGLKTLFDDGMLRARQGQTTIEEVNRVVNLA